jgi:hypothetical protein
MTKKNISLVVLVVLLAAFSLYLNRDRFRSDEIRIGNRSVPARGPLARRNQKTPTNPIVFFLNRPLQPLQLTSVKVISLSELETNKYPHAIWELTTASNSAPVKDFAYGANIRGMAPSVKGAVPDILQPGIRYRLFIQAGSLKAEHDFTPAPQTP